MKILDRYIFFSFLKTFLVVFVILVLIFLLQAIWTLISELAGKDLDVVILARLLFYLIPSLIPMVLPLTILVASIMTFGSFSENYEFAAMKSSGISLQRAMRSLIFFISILSVTTFFFANDVIPWSRYKTINLRQNIKRLKPSMGIVEGTFNQLGDYNIKVDKKSGDRGQYLKNVIIHKKTPGEKGLTIIKAKSGELVSAENSNILSLVLYDGNLYQRQYPKKYSDLRRRPFIKDQFGAYQFNIDLSKLNDVDMDENRYSNSAQMLNISELKLALDSIAQRYDTDEKNFSKTMMSRNGTDRILGRIPRLDTVKKKTKTDTALVKENGKINQPKVKVVDKPGKEKEYDIPVGNLNEFYDSYTLSERIRIADLALTSTRGTIRTLKGKSLNLEKKKEQMNAAIIEIHDKYALALMCYVLFFVGAPLGAIIRKGGIGMPMVVAIVLFLVYYYIGLFAKNSAKDGTLNPVIATWLSFAIMFPLSVFVTYRAATDRGFGLGDRIRGFYDRYLKPLIRPLFKGLKPSSRHS